MSWELRPTIMKLLSYIHITQNNFPAYKNGRMNVVLFCAQIRPNNIDFIKCIIPTPNNIIVYDSQCY